MGGTTSQVTRIEVEDRAFAMTLAGGLAGADKENRNKIKQENKSGYIAIHTNFATKVDSNAHKFHDIL